jgi:hypothetical protein
MGSILLVGADSQVCAICEYLLVELISRWLHFVHAITHKPYRKIDLGRIIAGQYRCAAPDPDLYCIMRLFSDPDHPVKTAMR